MARKATPSSGAARKRATAKPKAKATARKPARAASTERRKASGRRSSDMSASDALMKFLESPLVADLLAIGATAALAAVAARSSRDRGAKSAVKAAGAAAASAMGRRLSTEIEEIRQATKAKGGAKD